MSHLAVCTVHAVRNVSVHQAARALSQRIQSYPGFRTVTRMVADANYLVLEVKRVCEDRVLRVYHIQPAGLLDVQPLSLPDVQQVETPAVRTRCACGKFVRKGTQSCANCAPF